MSLIHPDDALSAVARITTLEKKVAKLEDALDFAGILTAEPRYVQVVYDEQDVESYHKAYTYYIPEKYGDPQVGDRVRVPAQGARKLATIIRVDVTPKFKGNIRPIDYYLR